jgi:hypothetical protein
VKPTNLVVTEVGRTDHGLALCDGREVDDEETVFFDRQDYLAPERLAGDAHTGDVFCLGRVFTSCSPASGRS